MPTYEYRCNDCGYEFEIFQSMKDDRLTACEKCNGTLKRLIGTGAGIIFKGSGFYETDFKDKKGKKPSKPVEKSENKEATKNKEKKTESKSSD